MPRELDRPRRAHRTDWMALLSGVLFVVLGILVMTRSIANPMVLLLVLLVGLGFAGTVAIISRVFRRE